MHVIRFTPRAPYVQSGFIEALPANTAYLSTAQVVVEATASATYAVGQGGRLSVLRLYK